MPDKQKHKYRRHSAVTKAELMEWQSVALKWQTLSKILWETIRGSCFDVGFRLVYRRLHFVNRLTSIGETRNSSAFLDCMLHGAVLCCVTLYRITYITFYFILLYILYCIYIIVYYVVLYYIILCCVYYIILYYIVLYLIKIFPAFYATRKFPSVLTTARWWFL